MRWVLIRAPENRFKTQAPLCTHLNTKATTIVHGFVHRWRLEVAFEAAQAYLGVETQRQGSKRAIARPTPLRLALLSGVTLIAPRRVTTQTLPVRTSAWYHTSQPTFSDALVYLATSLARNSGD